MARVFFETDARLLPRHLNHFQESVLEALRQLRLALGTGIIVYGLQVEATRGNSVVVQPGLAFDGQGDALSLAQSVPMALPHGPGPHILAVAYLPVVEERSPHGEALLERDSVDFRWLPGMPQDDSVVPLASISRSPEGRVLIDDRIARRGAPLDHRHTGALRRDRAGRMRSTGAPIDQDAVRPAELNMALERLRSEMLARIEALSAPAEASWEPGVALIHGIGDRMAQALGRAGVDNAAALLARTATLTGRQQLAQETGISAGKLEGFARIADFLRLHGVTPELALLLSEAGLRSVADLAEMAPPDINKRLRAVFDPDKYNAKKPPDLGLIRAWVQEAAQLRRIVIE